MSIFALFMAILFLSMHACNGRNSFAFIPYTKDAEKANLHEREMKSFPMFNTKETLLGSKAGTSMAILNENQTVEMQDLKGSARSMVEGASQEAEKPIKVSEKEEEDHPLADPTAMDYAPAHHETPIHNQH